MPDQACTASCARLLHEGRIRIGERSIDPGEVTGVSIVGEEKAGLLGNFAGFGAFLLGGCLIVSLIAACLLQPKFLIGAAVLAIVGLMSLQDSWLERGTGFYRLLLVTPDGLIEAYATSDCAEIAAVARVIESAIGARRSPAASSARPAAALQQT
jgi:hypothetical protein